MIQIQFATSDNAIQSCFTVLHQLRPHLVPDDFLARVRRMQQEGFLLAYLEEDGAVRAVAGYRYMDLLFSGLTLYVDDLVTDEQQRSRGHGAALLNWLSEQAKERQCRTLTLDSGVQREHAHRFYFREGMSIVGYHFSTKLP